MGDHSIWGPQNASPQIECMTASTCDGHILFTAGIAVDDLRSSRRQCEDQHVEVDTADVRRSVDRHDDVDVLDVHVDQSLLWLGAGDAGYPHCKQGCCAQAREEYSHVVTPSADLESAVETRVVFGGDWPHDLRQSRPPLPKSPCLVLYTIDCYPDKFVSNMSFNVVVSDNIAPEQARVDFVAEH